MGIKQWQEPKTEAAEAFEQQFGSGPAPGRSGQGGPADGPDVVGGDHDGGAGRVCVRVGAQDGGRVSGINPPTAPNTPLETTSQYTAKAAMTIL